MGYFSELDTRMKEERVGVGYGTHSEQLVCRYEDLKERCDELMCENAPNSTDTYFSKSDLLYAPIDCFDSISSVLCAMEAVKLHLEERYGITVGDEYSKLDEVYDDPNQISIYEIVCFTPIIHSANVA